MTYWEHALTVAFGVTLLVFGIDGSGSLVLLALFGGAALAAWGLFGGIETAVERGQGVTDESESDR